MTITKPIGKVFDLIVIGPLGKIVRKGKFTLKVQEIIGQAIVNPRGLAKADKKVVIG